MHAPDCHATLVSDFDGTMTRYDFYALVIQRWLPSQAPRIWQEYEAGRLTHFEGLQAIFAAIRADEAEVLQLIDSMQLDPAIPRYVQQLRAAGWEVVVASAGCQWYIDRLLDQQGVSLEVHANPGRFEPGQGLLMSIPESKYACPNVGIDKARIVSDAGRAGRTVAFAGDGYPDIDAALLVPAERRFARGALAELLRSMNESYQPFEVWSDVARRLLARD